MSLELVLVHNITTPMTSLRHIIHTACVRTPLDINTLAKLKAWGAPEVMLVAQGSPRVENREFPRARSAVYGITVRRASAARSDLVKGRKRTGFG